MPPTIFFIVENTQVRDRLSLMKLELFSNENWNTENSIVLFRVVHRYIHISEREEQGLSGRVFGLRLWGLYAVSLRKTH